MATKAKRKPTTHKTVQKRKRLGAIEAIIAQRKAPPDVAAVAAALRDTCTKQGINPMEVVLYMGIVTPMDLGDFVGRAIGFHAHGVIAGRGGGMESVEKAATKAGGVKG